MLFSLEPTDKKSTCRMHAQSKNALIHLHALCCVRHNPSPLNKTRFRTQNIICLFTCFRILLVSVVLSIAASPTVFRDCCTETHWLYVRTAGCKVIWIPACTQKLTVTQSFPCMRNSKSLYCWYIIKYMPLGEAFMVL